MFEAHLAYIDPASGSLLLQLLIGAIVGCGLFFRQAIARVARMFSRAARLRFGKRRDSIGPQ